MHAGRESGDDGEDGGAEQRPAAGATRTHATRRNNIPSPA